MEFFKDEYISSLKSKNCKHQIYYDNELWGNCSLVFPELKDWYFVSNFGRVYSSYSNIIMNQNIDPNGYYRLTLITNDNKSVRRSVHRLVLTVFNWFDGCNFYEVNHKDGNKLNNWIGNLEWVTKLENIAHSCNTGLHLYGENAYNAKYSNDTVIKIADMLENTDLSYEEISNIIFGFYNNDHYKLYRDIMYENTWSKVIGIRDFRKRYCMHFHPYASNANFNHLYPHYQTIPDHILYDIYEFYMNNPNVDIRYLAEKFIPNFNMLENNIKLSRIRSIRKLINNESFPHIRENYNYNHNIFIEGSTTI